MRAKDHVLVELILLSVAIFIHSSKLEVSTRREAAAGAAPSLVEAALAVGWAAWPRGRMMEEASTTACDLANAATREFWNATDVLLPAMRMEALGLDRAKMERLALLLVPDG